MGTHITAATAQVAQRHFQLVEALKKALTLSAVGFLRAGELLHEIKLNKTYHGEDAQNKWTWKMFCSRDDVAIPGVTGEARRRVADALIRVYETFILKHSCEPEELACVGWTKLDMISRKCQFETDKEKVLNWITKAKTLSAQDLYLETKFGSKSIKELMECTHENEHVEWRCPDCGQVRAEPMCKAHSEWSAVVRTKKPIPSWVKKNEEEKPKQIAGGQDGYHPV